MNCCQSIPKDDRLVASSMGMQVIHWEREGVMRIFREPSQKAAVAQLRELIKKKPSLVSKTNPFRDNVGAALLHWSVIQRGAFQNQSASAVVDYLIAEHSDSVVNVYYKEPDRVLGLFDGETALHLAVAFGDTPLIKLLLEVNVKCDSRAVGTFFATSGKCYFGEYPLFFAVSLGNIEVAELLVQSSNGTKLLELSDTFGNSALHLAVIHRRKEMFDWILDTLEEKQLMSKAEAMNSHGANALTPLGLAAILSHVDEGDMFNFVLERMCRIEWVFGRIICTSVPLDQIDTIPLGTQYHISILSLVLCRRIYELSTHPQLVGVIEAKWKQFGLAAFAAAFLGHVARLMAVTLLTMEYRNYSDTEDHDINEYRLLNGLEWIVFIDTIVQSFVVFLDCFAAYFEEMKLRGILKNDSGQRHNDIPETLCIPGLEVPGRRAWEELKRSNGLLKPSIMHTSWFQMHVPLSEYDFFAWIGQALLIIHFVVFHTSHQKPTPTSTAALSIGLLFIWLSTLKFTAFSKNLGMLTTIVFRTVKMDVSSFLVIFSIFLMGFGTALHVLTVKPSSYSHSLDKLVKTALGDTSSFSAWSTSEPGLSWLAYSVALCFAVCALMILLNLLVSIFSGTFASIQDRSEKEWRLSKGRATILIERRLRLLLPWIKDRLRVNHFSDFESDILSDKHRYVFVVENKDPPNDNIEEAVKKVFDGYINEDSEKSDSDAGSFNDAPEGVVAAAHSFLSKHPSRIANPFMDKFTLGARGKPGWRALHQWNNKTKEKNIKKQVLSAFTNATAYQPPPRSSFSHPEKHHSGHHEQENTVTSPSSTFVKNGRDNHTIERPRSNDFSGTALDHTKDLGGYPGGQRLPNTIDDSL